MQDRVINICKLLNKTDGKDITDLNKDKIEKYTDYVLDHIKRYILY